MLLLTLFLSLSNLVVAQPANLQFSDCFSGNDSLKLQISDVYAQLLHGDPQGAHLNFTLIGQTPQEIINAPDYVNGANGTGAASKCNIYYVDRNALSLYSCSDSIHDDRLSYFSAME